MAVKGRQTKLRDLHVTMPVVDVSCAPIISTQSSSLSTSDRIRPKKMLLKEHSLGFGARGTWNEASTAKTETTVGLKGSQSGLGP